MADSMDLTQIESHFAFGKNWASYAQHIGESEIAEAINGLKRLVVDRLDGKRFLDIGCGSGLHSLAALRLGASSVVGVDIDEDSVATTRAVLTRHAAGLAWEARPASVFEMAPSVWGQFDVVYSWVVLHHTGDMYRALRSAAALVVPGGAFVFALYRKTWMCGFWKVEKRVYTSASPMLQRAMRTAYIMAFKIGLWATGRSFSEYVRNYRSTRGMDYYHDVHDWLGGYPYESISVQEADELMKGLGFARARVFARDGRLFGRDLGLFGSGCDEFVYVRRT